MIFVRKKRRIRNAGYWVIVHGLHDADIFHSKRGVAVGKIIVPLADKFFVETKRLDFVQSLIEPFPPLRQRAHVVLSHVLEIIQNQIARGLNR